MVKAIPNELFIYELERRHWTDRKVADQILALIKPDDIAYRKKYAQTDEDRIKRWRKGTATPSKYFQDKLEIIFGKTMKQLGWPGKNEIPNWKLDYSPNPLFIGREEILQQLHNHILLRDKGITHHPQILTGMGGVGKSHIAIEYAYRYMHDYHTVVWLQAEEWEVLLTNFAAITTLLDLPEKDEQNQDRQIDAVKAWLKHEDITRWLFIFDSANNPKTLEKIFHRLIPVPCQGHVILTTQLHATGESGEERIVVDKLPLNESTTFLLKRAKIPFSETSSQHAYQIARELDCLPLALDQAGAYIEQTNCSLENYFSTYQTEHGKLLHYPEEVSTYHPQPIDTTLSLALEKLQSINPVAIDLLSLFAFLASETIPEEIVTEGGHELSPSLQTLATSSYEFNRVMGDILKYSLIRRDPGTKTCNTHQLVQISIKDRMDEATQCLWAERAVHAVNHVFPAATVDTFVECEKYLAHVIACKKYIDQWNIVSKEAGRLLNDTGAYFFERGRYKEAEIYFKGSLHICRQILKPGAFELLQSLNNLGAAYNALGLYAEAEQLYKEILASSDGIDQHHLNQALRGLAFSHLCQGNYVEAETYYLHCLDICEQLYGMEHSNTGIILNNLSVVYNLQKKYEKSIELDERILALNKKHYGEEHPSVARSLNNLACSYRDTGKYEQAESLYMQALSMRKKTLGPEHPDVANTLHGIGELYRRKKDYDKAEQYSVQALKLREDVLGPDHIDTAFTLFSLAQTYDTQQRDPQAEEYYRRALTIREKIMGKAHPHTMEVVENYVSFLRKIEQEDKAREVETRFHLI